MSDRTARFIADAQRAHKRVARLERQVETLKQRLAVARRVTIPRILLGVGSAYDAGIIAFSGGTRWEVATHIAKHMRRMVTGGIQGDLCLEAVDKLRAASGFRELQAKVHSMGAGESPAERAAYDALVDLLRVVELGRAGTEPKP